jgi:tRNA 2-thiouridine synthesizing protein B
MLHIIKHYHSCTEAFSNALEGDELILVEDAVYAAIADHKANALLTSVSLPVYVLQPDIEARGLALCPKKQTLQAVDFAGFVDLTTRHQSSITWE